MSIKFIEAPIVDVQVFPLKPYHDKRGWLTELFRHDEIANKFWPVMGYVSLSHPGVSRGPHEHRDQADLFCFMGPGDFLLALWDNRPASSTYLNRMVFSCGECDWKGVIVPCGVVHAYGNLSQKEGVVLNFPNQLYAGEKKKEPVDEIRHEEDPSSPFTLDFKDVFHNRK